jgi:hypothetical protein
MSNLPLADDAEVEQNPPGVMLQPRSRPCFPLGLVHLATQVFGGRLKLGDFPAAFRNVANGQPIAAGEGVRALKLGKVIALPPELGIVAAQHFA